MSSHCILYFIIPAIIQYIKVASVQQQNDIGFGEITFYFMLEILPQSITPVMPCAFKVRSRQVSWEKKQKCGSR